MGKRRTIAGILTACGAGILASCASLQPSPTDAPPPPPPSSDASKTALRRAELAPDAVSFDALLVHVPYQDRALVEAFWNDVDEQEIDPETRRYLNEQGFRAGLIGASIPDSLSRLLTLKGRELRSTLEEEVDPSKKSTGAPVAYSKPINLRAGMKSVIEARGDVIPAIPILENQNGALVGKSYNDAQTLFSVAIDPAPDGSVRFDVTPFLRYGAPRLATRYQHGQLVRTQEQPTKTFDALKCSLALRPGQFLAIGASDAKTSALGRWFFTDGGDDYDQKILVLRLLVTQHDGEFDRFPDFREIVRRENEKNGVANDEFETNVDLYVGVEGFEKPTLTPEGALEFKPEFDPNAANFADYNADGANEAAVLEADLEKIDASAPADEILEKTDETERLGDSRESANKGETQKMERLGDLREGRDRRR
ncbi:MAG: hypothetical protein IJ991_07340 [Thermoguttaceae bacterium]|nr:hypothetical protein [Thermoguttaceae bacterium]